MAKNEILKKISKLAKDKAVDLAGEYIDKAKMRASEAIMDYASDAGSRAGKYINSKINKGASNITSKIVNDDARNINELDEQLNNEEYDAHIQEPYEETLIKENMSEADDKKFVNGVCSQVLNNGLTGLTTPSEAISIVKNLAQIKGEVEKFREIQKTKRDAINAKKEIYLEKIQLQKKLLLKYLNDTYDERKESFKKYFEVIDDAIKKDNTQQLALGLNSINELAKSCPFKNLENLNQVGRALQDDGHEWDF